MKWRNQRQIFIFLIYFLIFSLPFLILAFYLSSSNESCFDNKKGTSEDGIDCGGVCSLQCKETYRQPKISFTRALAVSKDKYDVVAVLENYNKEVFFPNITYTISAYTANADLLLSATGSTKLLQNTRGIIYLPNINSKQFPKVVDIKLSNSLAFKQNETQIQKYVRTGAWTSQRTLGNNLQVVAKISNTNVNSLGEMDVYALLYDDTKTVYATGKTYISGLSGREESAVVFTWGEIKSPANVDFVIIER